MSFAETPEYFRFKTIYGKKVAERYAKLITSPNYRTEINPDYTEEKEEKRGRPRSCVQRSQEPLPDCLNVAGVRLTPAMHKKILGAIAIFPSVHTYNYRFQLIPRTLFATAKEMGWRYNVKLERWEYLDYNIKRRPT